MNRWLKSVLVVVFGLSEITTRVFGGPAYPCTLQWQPSGDPAAAGYALYYGATGSPTTNRLDVGTNTLVTLNTLNSPSTYSFFVVAYDTNQDEGLPSNLLIYTASAISALQLAQPVSGGIQISFQVATGTTCHVEFSDTLNPPHWTTLTSVTADATGIVAINDPIPESGGTRFYRGVVP